MCLQQIVQHLERAFIEVQYATADIAYRSSSSSAPSDATENEAMRKDLFNASYLLQEVLAVSLERHRANERAKLPDPTFPAKGRARKARSVARVG